MKTNTIFNTIALSLITLLAACGQTPAPADTAPPTVTLASSTNSVNTPSTLTLSASASDNVGVRKVEFFEDQNKLGEDTSAPFSFDIALSPANNGNKKYLAKAFDAAGNFSSSSSISVRVDISTSGTMQLSFGSLFSTPPNVLVKGPGGFEQRITSFSATSLQNLVPGIYTVTAENVRAPGILADTVLEGKGGEFEVKAGANTQAQIPYTPRGGSGLLWVPVVRDNKLSAFTPATNTSSLTTAIGTNAFPNAMAFDRFGNLWVSNSKGDSIFKYTPAQLASSGTPAPAVVLSDKGGSLSAPIGLAFDKDGGLWVANNDANTVVRFSPDQLAASGSPVPAVTLKSNSSQSLSIPMGLAFDAQGGLWVANLRAGTVVKFASNQLARSGEPTPAVTLGNSPVVGAVPVLSKPSGLAFDKDGSLWVANVSANTLVRYSLAQQAASGTPNPAVTIKSTNLAGPSGLAFDNQGNLWVTNSSSHALVRFPASDLVSSGTVAGVVAVANLGATEVALPAFSPAPLNLPINQ